MNVNEVYLSIVERIIMKEKNKFPKLMTSAEQAREQWIDEQFNKEQAELKEEEIDLFPPSSSGSEPPSTPPTVSRVICLDTFRKKRKVKYISE